MSGIISGMAKYPIFLELRGRRVVIVGGGTVATRKAETLLKAGARLVIVAEKTNETLRSLCAKTKTELIEGRYSKDYLAGATLAIAATDIEKLNEQIYRDCQQLEVLCNVVDSPELCDFYVPAVVQRGDLQIAVGTEGSCPAYAGHLRKKLEKIFTEEHGQFLAELEAARKQITEDINDADMRKVMLGRLVDDESFEFFVAQGAQAWRKRAEELVNKCKSADIGPA